ncbi:MAG: DUF3140 domain-containing protein [Phycisphaerae bacterium]
MSETDGKEKPDIRKDFYDHVNMSPRELESWIETDESKQTGWDPGRDDAPLHPGGARKEVELRGGECGVCSGRAT